MDVLDLAQALSSRTRVELLELVGDQALTSAEIHRKYEKKKKEPTNRETVYRNLEKLVEAGLLSKGYDQEEKELVYRRYFSVIRIDLAKMELETTE